MQRLVALAVAMIAVACGRERPPAPPAVPDPLRLESPIEAGKAAAPIVAPRADEGTAAPLPALTLAQIAEAGIDDASIAHWRALHQKNCSDRAAAFGTWSESPPAPESDRCPNEDECDWRIAWGQGHLTLSARRFDSGDGEVMSTERPPFSLPAGSAGMRGTRLWARMADGWLGGFDAGEWGGALWWFSTDGSVQRRLLEDNVTGIIDVGGERWVSTGLDHMRNGTGRVLRVVRDGNGWKVEPLATLEQSAYVAISEGSRSALVVTRTQLVRVDSSGRVTRLHDGHWNSLYPSTALIDSSGRVLIGARHAVIRLEPRGNGYTETWLVSPSCVAYRDITCQCEPLWQPPQ